MSEISRDNQNIHRHRSGTDRAALRHLPRLAHDGDHEGEGKDAPGEVDPNFPTEAILGDAGARAPPVSTARRLLPVRQREPVQLPAHVGDRRRPRLGRLGLDGPRDRTRVRARRPRPTARPSSTSPSRAAPVYLGNLPTPAPTTVNSGATSRSTTNHAFIVAEAQRATACRSSTSRRAARPVTTAPQTVHRGRAALLPASATRTTSPSTRTTGYAYAVGHVNTLLRRRPAHGRHPRPEEPAASPGCVSAATATSTTRSA